MEIHNFINHFFGAVGIILGLGLQRNQHELQVQAFPTFKEM